MTCVICLLNILLLFFFCFFVVFLQVSRKMFYIYVFVYDAETEYEKVICKCPKIFKHFSPYYFGLIFAFYAVVS